MYIQKINQAIVDKTLPILLPLLLLVFSSKLLAAQPDCENLYNQLSAELDTIITDQYPASRAKRLHEMENKLFTGFKSCPGSTLLYTLMGEVQISLDNIGLALLYAKKSMKLDSSYWQTHHLMGNSLCMQEQCDEGLVHLEKAAKLAPGKPELQFNLCSTYLVANKPRKAINACSQFLARDDHELHGPAYYTRGMAHEQLDNVRKAQQDFNQAESLGYSASK